MTGLVMTPTRPLPTPLKNPPTPSCSAPSRGRMTTPASPDVTLLASDSAPRATP
ncbi:hypothetical protein FBU31_003445 [Coemansia sp. 'formosensis']|nr:hypothetical protein FBU31_003445 [Coemansia sp. 'formosensis']